MIPADPLHQFWHTPIGVHRFAQADDVNEVLVRVFQTMRATDAGAVDGPKTFYASRDDLLHRIKLSEWEQLLAFFIDSVRQTVVLANQGAWPEAKPGFHIVIVSFNVSVHAANGSDELHGYAHV